jgi:pentatricopeptide repeat protein
LIENESDRGGCPESVPCSALRAHKGDDRQRHNAKQGAHGVVSYEKQITKLGRLGHIDQALQLFSSLESPTIRQVNAVLDACARADPPRIKTSLEIFRSNFGGGLASKTSGGSGSVKAAALRPNVYTFGALVAGYSRAGNAALATRLLADMSSVYGVAPNSVVYHSAISACARSVPARVDLALRLLEQAKDEGIPITVIGYNAAVAAAARSADTETALQLLNEMEDRGEASSSVLSSNSTAGIACDATPRADAVTYATVLAACEISKQWELCLQVAERMKARGFVLDGMAYTSVLHACQQLGLAEKAIEYLSMMKAKTSSYQRWTAGRQVASSLPDLLGPDEVAYRLVISACARGRALKEALQVLDEFCAQHPAGGDVVAYTAAITACEYVGDWRTAISLLERMRKCNIQPNEVTFAAVIGACATSLAGMALPIPDRDDLSSLPLPQLKALQLLQLLKKDESLPNPNIIVYNAAIRACAEAMDVKTALKLLRDLRSEGLESTIVTFGCLMTACERVGSATAASKVFKSLREDGLEPNEIIYGAAISCCRKAGERERALLLLKKMIRDEKKPNVAVFNTVLMAQTDGSPSEQDLENALLTYKILRQYKHATPNRQTYNIIIRSLAAQRQPRQAEKLLNDMQEDGLVPDVDLFTATVSAYERMGQPLKALSLMESMRAKGYDFYESAVLNTAFKKAVKLVNAVGRGLVSSDDSEEQSTTTSSVFGLKPR